MNKYSLMLVLEAHIKVLEAHTMVALFQMEQCLRSKRQILHPLLYMPPL